MLILKIEVWSDYACPFCYIGKRHLEEALENFSHNDTVSVEYKSFELDPNAEIDTSLSVYELLAKKYGTSIDQAKKMTQGLVEQGQSAGLQFHFDTNIPTNTFDAHRLTKFARTKGKAVELAEIILRAHLVDSLHIGNKSTLLDLAEKAGLDREKSETVLAGREFSEEVRFDENEAKEIGVQGVPFFVFNRKYAISGAQPTEVFVNTIEKILEEEKSSSPFQTLGTANGLTCNEDGCE